VTSATTTCPPTGASADRCRVREIHGQCGHQGTRRGLSLAHRRRGLSLDDRMIARCKHQSEEGGYAATRELLSSTFRPSAIFCTNDAIAIGAMRAIFQAGLDIPRDISLVGFDDIPVACLLRVPLTTVAQPREAPNLVLALRQKRYCLTGGEDFHGFRCLRREEQESLCGRFAGQQALREDVHGAFYAAVLGHRFVHGVSGQDAANPVQQGLFRPFRLRYWRRGEGGSRPVGWRLSLLVAGLFAKRATTRRHRILVV
jgi:Periplasmic binding protein-like domain